MYVAYVLFIGVLRLTKEYVIYTTGFYSVSSPTRLLSPLHVLHSLIQKLVLTPATRLDSPLVPFLGRLR